MSVIGFKVGNTTERYNYPALDNRPDISQKVNMPLSNGQVVYGVYGQVLASNGDGSTSWVRQGSGGGGGATIQIINNKLMISTSSSSDGDSSNIVGTGTVGHMTLNDSSGGSSSNIVGTGTVGRMVV